MTSKLPRRLHLAFTAVITVATASAAGCATTAESSRQAATFSARKQLTRELVARREWATAFANANDLHRLQPEDAEVLVLRGIVYREQQMPGEAEADLRAALAEDGKSADAHAALAILLDTSSRGVEAETHHRRAVELQPKSSALLNNLGFSLLTRRKNKEALEVLRRAARLDPTARRVRTNLGFAYAALGDLPRAASEFDMGGAPAEAKNNLGFAYESRGDLGNAFDLYVGALRADPHCGRARQNLAHVAGKLGREIPPELRGDSGPQASTKEQTP
jgi:Flp pilus assembly protein TadD